MRANRIKVGTIVDISLGNPKAPEFVPLAAEVVDTETNAEAVAGIMGLDPQTHPDNLIALRLRQEGKNRGCWVAMPATNQVRTLRR